MNNEYPSILYNDHKMQFNSIPKKYEDLYKVFGNHLLIVIINNGSSKVCYVCESLLDDDYVVIAARLSKPSQ